MRHPTRSRLGLLAATVACGALVSACSAAPAATLPDVATTVSARLTTTAATSAVTTTATSAITSATTSASTSARPTPTTPPPAPRATTPKPAPVRVDPDAAMADVRAIVRFGPRDAVSPAYHRAADHVAGRFTQLGYRVTEQSVPMPAGVSWGVRVPSGSTVNLVVDPSVFDPTEPHVVLGAHLDTAPQAPGAEDNASGVAVLLELARMLRLSPAEVPVRFVVFGGEEARGGAGTRYAFGSRHFVRELPKAQRKAVVGMVALDRVGVATSRVPVCFGGRGTDALATEIRAAASAGAAGKLATQGCRNRASDHVSFEAVGIPVARLGSVPYDAYHSAQDVPSVVDPAQLARSAAVVWNWLQSPDH